MLPDWYSAWVRSHLVRFGMVNPDNVAMFGSWWTPFAARNVTGQELAMATETIHNRNTHPSKASDHYLEIKLVIATARDSAVKRIETNYAPDRGVCSDCGETGYIAVPHPRFCNAVEWSPSHHNFAGDPVYATAAVICRCWKGRKFAAAQENEILNGAKKQTMTIGEYEDQVNGDWRRQMRSKLDADKAVTNAQHGMPKVSEKEMIARLAAAFAGGKA